MTVLFISRKKINQIGGLSKFATELIAHYPQKHYLLSPNKLELIPQLPFLKINLIHLTDATLLPIGFLLKFLLKIPFTVTIHGLDLFWKNYFYQKMLKILLPKASAIIFDSPGPKKLLSSFKSTDIRIINPGISISQLQKKEPTILPNHKGKIFLLTVGHLIERKGQYWFIEKVLPKLPEEFIYLVVGKGRKFSDIQKLIRRLKLNSRVFLLGSLNHHQLGYVLAKTDIYVCPNQEIKGDFEGFGIAAGEAAACGLPVVASNVDGIPEAIKHGKNGLLTDPTPIAFIKTLTGLNRKKRQLLGQKARLFTLKHYTWKKTIKKYLRVFKNLQIKA